MNSHGLDGFEDQRREVPDDVYASLVDSLYGEARSMLIGSGAASLGALVTAYKTGSLAILVCAGLIVAVAALRAGEMRRYSASRGDSRSRADVRRWEVRYAAGAAIYVALLGFFCFLSMALTDDPFAHLISFGTVVAYLIGVSGRNFASDTLIASQITGATVPVVAGLATLGGYYWAVIALVIAPLMLAMKFISARLRTTLLKAVIGARTMTVLASRFDTALNNMPHGLAMFDADRRIVVQNRRFFEMLGMVEGDLSEGATAADVVELCRQKGLVAEGEGRELSAALGAQSLPVGQCVTVLKTDGRILSLSAQPMAGGGWVSLVEDVTERRAAERKINHLATFDTLTGLPNRNALRYEMEQLAHSGRRWAVLFVDLDHFKQINDTLGHGFGDRLLCVVADRLRLIGGGEMPTARFGGDEFVVIVRDADAGVASAKATEIIAALSKRYDIDDHKLVIGASVGIALAHGQSDDPDQLLQDADTALYEAKSNGRGHWCFFKPEMAEKALNRRNLELDLRAAVEQRGFELAYQPIFDLGRSQFGTCEALLRWNHAERGPVSPAEFIPIAEETGLIVQIGRWVLQEACRECLQWPGGVRVAVNISPVQFRYDNVADAVEEALSATGLAPERLEVEITESALLRDEGPTLVALARIRAMGVSIALDDFGTGYSSLSYMKSFEFSKVKIDRSFIRELASEVSSRTLLRGIARLSSELGMRVTVEGIETDEQLRLLSQFSFIDEIQGFFFSRPLPAQDVRLTLARDQSRVRQPARVLGSR